MKKEKAAFFLFLSWTLKFRDLSHNKLTGSIPTISDPNDSLFTVDLSFNCLDLKGNTLKNTIRRTVSLGNNDPNGSTIFPTIMSSAVSVVMRMFLLLSSSLLLLSSLSAGTDEGDALMAMKNILNDPNNVLKSWNNATSPPDPCANPRWDHIECSSFEDGIGGPMYDSVTDIILTNAQLSGQLPQLLSHLLKLPNLENLNLQGNNIGGVIPPEVCNLPSLLHLSLDDNHLTGPIPNTLGQAPFLQTLSLKNNGLSGNIPDSLNQLDRLYEVDLSDNQLDGSIPDSLGNCIQLTDLYLKNNGLNGNIPESFNNLHYLQHLDLSHNKLTGFIPTISDPNESLVTVDLSFNCLDLKGNTLGSTGTRTVSLGNNDPNGCPQS
ncbi:unnamed protein product [Cuscuta campestris]|uniref:Leucine-rich repeat-containing N-terminal plant-type domain-containing protein n=1 Tax=Cuscuta campestris TaxID=132261 RepID=A0A484MLD1_9ASTE|nr:unnamed protein product [Cuscuta campestris]